MNIIKEIREEKGLSQNEMSLICEVGRQTICDIESGTRKSLNKRVLQGIDSLGYNPEEVEETYHYQRQQQKENILSSLK